jgi:alpha-ketoglutarate-dependent taurine dioxygenase
MPKLIQPSAWHEVPIVIPDGPGEELLSVDRNTIVEQFKTYGVVLFRSFSIGIERFQALVRSCSKTQILYPGNNRVLVSQDGKLQTVAVSANSIPLHSELSHTPFRPEICWFYCVTAPSRGSETTLCDGSMLASELPIPIFQLLQCNMLRYRRTTSVAFLERLLGKNYATALRELLISGPHSRFYEIRGKEVFQDFVAPALHNAKFLRKPVFANNIIHNFRP